MALKGSVTIMHTVDFNTNQGEECKMPLGTKDKITSIMMLVV